jgi:hypothetical protein
MNYFMVCSSLCEAAHFARACAELCGIELVVFSGAGTMKNIDFIVIAVSLST